MAKDPLAQIICNRTLSIEIKSTENVFTEKKRGKMKEKIEINSLKTLYKLVKCNNIPTKILWKKCSLKIPLDPRITQNTAGKH